MKNNHIVICENMHGQQKKFMLPLIVEEGEKKVLAFRNTYKNHSIRPIIIRKVNNVPAL